MLNNDACLILMDVTALNHDVQYPRAIFQPKAYGQCGALLGCNRDLEAMELISTPTVAPTIAPTAKVPSMAAPLAPTTVAPVMGSSHYGTAAPAMADPTTTVPVGTTLAPMDSTSGFAVTQAQFLQADNSCLLVHFLPFTDLRDGPPQAHADISMPAYGYGTWKDQASLGDAALSWMVAAELARVHFNSRNATLVPELGDLGSCSVTLASPQQGSRYINTGYDRRYAVSQFQDLLTQQANICAVIGPVNPSTARGLQVINEELHVPQIAFNDIGYRMSNRHEFPTFARVIPEAYDFGEAVAKFFQRDIFHRETAGIIYDDTDFGEQFESPIEDLEEDFNYVTITESFDQGDNEAIAEAFQEALDNGYRTIVLITDRIAALDDIANVADEMGMLGEGWFWILNGVDLITPHMAQHIQYPEGSAADRLLRGAALFTNYDPFMYSTASDEDAFVAAWKEQGTAMLPLFDQFLPKDPKTGEALVSPSSQHFADAPLPSVYSSFVYDAVITAGLSACHAQDGDNDEQYKNGLYLNPHIESVFETDFQGASGRVRFKVGEDLNGNDVFENSRDAEDVVFGMYNVQPRAAVNEDGMRRYNLILTHVYSHENEIINQDGEGESGAWKAVPGTEFLFFDGTTNEPMPRRETFDPHYISDGFHVVGIFLSSLAVFLAIASGTWVFFNRDKRLVRAAQPEFLYLLCVGATLVAASSIFVSFDEDKGKSEEQLDRLCSAFPWFAVVGYSVMYCALFSKLWRLSQLMQMRRKAVKIQQVLAPFCILNGCILVILTVWQIVKPFQWERSVISEEPYETYGECVTEDGSLPFTIPIAVLMFLALLTTAYYSWKLRNVQSELSESKMIFAGIFIHIQTWLVGVPIFYITDGVSKDAMYMMTVILTFTFSTSLVGFLIWPKIYVSVRDKFCGGPSFPSTRINLSGGNSTRVSGISHGLSSGFQNSSVGSSRHLTTPKQSKQSSNPTVSSTANTLSDPEKSGHSASYDDKPKMDEELEI